MKNKTTVVPEEGCMRDLFMGDASECFHWPHDATPVLARRVPVCVCVCVCATVGKRESVCAHAFIATPISCFRATGIGSMG